MKRREKVEPPTGRIEDGGCLPPGIKRSLVYAWGQRVNLKGLKRLKHRFPLSLSRPPMDRGGFSPHCASGCLSSGLFVREPQAAVWAARSERLEKSMTRSGCLPLEREFVDTRARGSTRSRLNGENYKYNRRVLRVNGSKLVEPDGCMQERNGGRVKMRTWGRCLASPLRRGSRTHQAGDCLSSPRCALSNLPRICLECLVWGEARLD